MEFSGDAGWLLYALQIHYGFLLKEHLLRSKESVEHDCLERHDESSLKLCQLMKWFNFQFVFIDKRS